MVNNLFIITVIVLVIDLISNAIRVSMIYVRVPDLLSLKDKYPEGVEYTLKLLETPTLPISIRFVTVMLHFLLAVLIFSYVSRSDVLNSSPWIMALSLLCIGILIIVLEFSIQRLVYKSIEDWALRLTPLAQMLDIVFRPVNWLLNLVLGTPDALIRTTTIVTEDEIKNWVEADHTEGSLEIGERKMIYSIFHFSDTLSREIMVPRIDIFALDINTSLPEAVAMVMQSGHSRLPVFEDTIDNVIGLLYAKDLLRLQLEGEDNLSIRELLRQAYFVPEAKKVDELLREMQARGIHMAIVVDEYGGMAGLVTLEDIVEEIVGEIRDEYDQKEELLYQRISNDEYLFHGRIDLDDFNEVVGTHLSKEVADTLGGIIYGEVGRVPVGGEEIEVEGWKLVVEQVLGRRIVLVRATRILDAVPDMDAKDKNNTE